MPSEPKRRPIWVSPSILRRVESLKIIDEEPAWRVVERLLDEHEARAPSAPAVEGVPESKHPIAHAVGEVLSSPFRRRPGRDGEAPGDQAAPGVPA